MIQRIRATNFKGFAQLDLPCAPLNLLTGLNGSGKSTVLQVLLLLRQSWDHGLLQENSLALNGDLVQLGTARDVLYSYAATDEISLGLDCSGDASLTWSFEYKGESDVLTGRRVGSSGIEACAALFTGRFHYLCAERIGPRAAFSISDFAVRQQRQVGVRGEYAAHFLGTYGQEPVVLAGAVHPGAVSTDLASQVNAWLGDISPGALVSLQAHAALDLVQLSYQFSTDVELTDRYRPTNVGFGLTYTLPLIVGLLSAKPGALLLLESPEAHLHPRGQRRMGELVAAVAANGVQVFVETHSDHFLNGVRLQAKRGQIKPTDIALHFFGRTVGDESSTRISVTSPSVDAEGRISQWPEGFFDEWDAALAELLAPRG